MLCPVKNFETDTYLSEFATFLEDYEHGLVKNSIDFFHEVFHAGNIKGNRLLDVGTGPNIASVISAAPHCKSIVLSEYEPQNRLALKKWLDGKLQRSFCDVFKYISDKENNKECTDIRESRLRQKVMAILPVDLRLEEPYTPLLLPQFDIITSCLCIGAASSNYNHYKKIAVRIMSLLAPGGHFVTNGVLNQTAYTVGDVSFDCCKLTPDMVKAAWKEAGLQIITYKEKKMPIDFGNGDSLFFLHGQK